MLEGLESEDTDWIVTRPKGKNDRDRKDKNRLIRTDVALDQAKSDVYITEYIEDSDDFPEYTQDRKKAREAAAKVKGIFETIRNYQIPVVVLESDAPLESVCRVFETINSTGTRLTTFDLAVARYFPDPDLRNMWESSREQYDIFREFDVDGERVLQIISLWNAIEQGKFLEPTRKNILGLEPRYINSKWKDAASCLAWSYDWVSKHGAQLKTIPNSVALVSIAAFCGVRRYFIGDPKNNFNSVLKKWYLSKCLEQGSRQASNYKIGRDFLSFLKYADENEDLNFAKVTLNPSMIVDLSQASDTRYKSLQCIMAMYAKSDIMTGSILDGENVEEHHIFPRAFLKKNGVEKKLINSIANKIFVSKKTNRELSDRPPVEYFQILQDRAVKTRTEPDVNQRLRESFIPGRVDNISFLEGFSVSRYQDFLANRAKMIFDCVRHIVGDQLSESALTEN